jgi:hypothetical protein
VQGVRLQLQNRISLELFLVGSEFILKRFSRSDPTKAIGYFVDDTSAKEQKIDVSTFVLQTWDNESLYDSPEEDIVVLA